jgi:hypothetical protein
MRKLSLSILALFFQILSAFSQTDSSAYKERKLKIDEVNFVSGYYMQDGNNSAVTGGIGTEKLTDFANTIELKLVKPGKGDKTHNFSLEMGIDHYTSASSDKIDPNTVSSASYSDTRYYPSLNYNLNDNAKGLIIGGALSFSTEFDYKSIGLGLNIAKISKDKNRELALKLQGYFDTWTVILPVELRSAPFSDDGTRKPRDSYSASLTLSQVINPRLQLAFLIDGIYQQGLLATRYQRVYFTNNSEKVETLPDKRTKIPFGLRASYFMGDRFILRAFYRYYMDDWGIKAHTLNLELPIKLSPFVSLSPFYRYYTQTAADYFAPYGAHSIAEPFYSSDYDLSAFNSQFFGAGLRLMPAKGVFRIAHFTMLELRYGHYTRSTGLSSDIITLNAKFK